VAFTTKTTGRRFNGMPPGVETLPVLVLLPVTLALPLMGRKLLAMMDGWMDGWLLLIGLTFEHVESSSFSG